MAVLPNKPNVTWNGVTSVRPPVAGDITSQFNPIKCEDEYAIYDGKKWTKMHSPITSTSYLTANGSGTYASNRPTISATERELIFEFLKQNMRVAEYIQRDGKPPIVQLEMRAGEGYVWEQVKRVKTTDPL